ncbi:hypothetical protein BUALT_Bualt05G0171400 [Buddleja alternifolia]|uniref:Uncharacterized protein n=1 Tax=Buddleja alternifolia TaxID=168488 RepID=A0AAV6XWC0_9LAMI|nr:hypothetical protein BUALT_Bualt05G0171400 [Buddleja alternifolia]
MMRRQQAQSQQQDYQSKIFYELSSLVLNIIRSPSSPIDFSDQTPHRRRRPGPSFEQITPAGFASLLMGISLALMLCGSVTFFLGFILMPWVLGLVMFLYFVGMVSTISMIGRAIFCHNSAPVSPTKHVPCRSMFDAARLVPLTVLSKYSWMALDKQSAIISCVDAAAPM